MSAQLKRVAAVVAGLAFLNVACFSSYRISTTELEKLQIGFEADEVPVIIDGCGGSSTAAPILLAQAGDDGPIPYEDDIDPDTGCPTVLVSATNAINVITTTGETHRITPFAFTLSNGQLVSPDYDLLLSTDDVEGAEVEIFSGGKTIGLLALITATAVGSFLAISLLAGEGRGLGGS
jgi:hypothetical protein